MSPVYFLKHTIFPEVGQGAISYTLSYTCPEVFQLGQARARKVKESVIGQVTGSPIQVSRNGSLGQKQCTRKPKNTVRGRGHIAMGPRKV